MGLIPRYHLYSGRKLRLALYPDQHQDCAVTGLPVPVYFFQWSVISRSVISFLNAFTDHCFTEY